VSATQAVDTVALATTWDPLLSVRALAAYSSLSERLLRSFLRDPEHPLPHYRIGGRVLVRRSEFDAWLTVYHQTSPVDEIVARILEHP
jgi:excisionase family DNA binding protein